jgi:hypothetical protein
MPIRSPVKTVWPPAPIVTACELSKMRPFEENSARLVTASSMLLAATESTQGACENGLRLISVSE